MRSLARACSALLLASAAGCFDSSGPQPLPCTVVLSGRCWTHLGLPGEWITAVAVTADGVLAGTTTRGVLRVTAAGVWTSLGLSGRRITSIAVLPPPSSRILVTATPLAGDTTSAVVYASDDAGVTWYPSDGGLSSQRGYAGYAFSLRFDSSDLNRLYLGLVAAIMRSVDGGATWETVRGDPQATGGAVWCLAVTPGDSGRVWAGGENVGTGPPFLLRSDDRGTTWTQFAPTPYFGDAVLSIATDPAARDRVYVGMASGVRVTEDAGATWRLLMSPHFPGPITQLATVGNSLVAISDELIQNSVPTTYVLGLYRTTDHGSTWDTLPVPPSAAGGISLAVSGDGVAYIGTASGLWSVPLP